MINFRASFQYRLNKNGLVDLYMKYGKDYKTPCVKLAVDKLNEFSSKYEAAFFFRNLTIVASDMKEALNKDFMTECYARIESL